MPRLKLSVTTAATYSKEEGKWQR